MSRAKTLRISRQFWVVLHRYAGLYMALFLTVAGLTGSVLAFRPDIDEWLNPGRYHVPLQSRPMLDPFALRARAEAIVPQAQIDEVELGLKPGEVCMTMFGPRIDPNTGKPFDLKYSMIRLNPYTGELIEMSDDGNYWPVTRKNLMDFVYALHHSLALGRVGEWLLGVAAVIWSIDCFVGFYLTLPAKWKRAVNGSKNSLKANSIGFWRRWAVAWKIKWDGAAHRINFDLHRACGLWVWPLLFVFAWSSVDFNLGEQVYEPVMHLLFSMPSFETYPFPPNWKPHTGPELDWSSAHAIAKRLISERAQQTGFKVVSEDRLVNYRAEGVYIYSVRSDHDFVDAGGISTILFDSRTGAMVGEDLPFGRNLGVTVSYWLVSLHMSHVGGLPYRIFVFVLGILIALLSVTGVLIWWKKRAVRKLNASRSPGLPLFAQPNAEATNES